ncbi:MAG: SDR family oxidoreductase [Anaerolineales bacterium]|nr:SDR family oxidoreductase [Anaerolineales bacterium]
MRILVTGASGLLGLNLGLQLYESQEIIGVDRSKLAAPPFELVRAELLDIDAFLHLLTRISPEAVIHTAANANVDSCEKDPEGARKLNAWLPGQLSKACAVKNIRMLHISTDAVFDGMKEDGFYTEEDETNPLSIYARTKRDGETAVLENNPEAVVARVNFFGWSLSGRRSLSEFFFNKFSAHETCNGFSDVYFCPMFVGDLAETLVAMLEKGLSGLYHVVGNESLTKFEFGVRIARQFGFDEGLIHPISVEDSGLTAKRSRNLRLSVHKLSTALGREIPSVSTGLTRFYTQYQHGYPQKIRSYQQFL